MGEERGHHIWKGLSIPPIKKQHWAGKTLPPRAQHQGRKLTSNFSCFLEPGQGSPDFSILFSSPLASPSVFSGGRATAGGRNKGAGVSWRAPSHPRARPCGSVWRPSLPWCGGPTLPGRFARVKSLCPPALLMPRVVPGEDPLGCPFASCSDCPVGLAGLCCLWPREAARGHPRHL